MGMNLKETVLTEAEIRVMVARVAEELRRDLADVERPLFVGIMKGVYIWMADLLRELSPTMNLEMDYIDVSSYVGDSSTGAVTIQRDLKTDLAGRTVIILDEVVDTGLTLRVLKADFERRGAKKVLVAVAVDKRDDVNKGGITPDYVGAKVPDLFLVGYGMDFNNNYRNLPYVAVLKIDD
jgi:hypoxanthine phosphoribosyltransferase